MSEPKWDRSLEPRPGDLVSEWRNSVWKALQGTHKCTSFSGGKQEHAYWGFNSRGDVGYVACLRCGWQPPTEIPPSKLVNPELQIVEHPLPEGVKPLAVFPTPGFDPLRDRSQDDKQPSIQDIENRSSEHTIQIQIPWPEDYQMPGEQAARILGDILPGLLSQFLRKNRSYQLSSENLAEMLGAKGQWGDLFRKIMVTKSALWDGKGGYLLTADKLIDDAYEESVEERLEDIVGHALLAIDMLRQGNRG